jgi:sigma-E factor negative regulatory protein RseC
MSQSIEHTGIIVASENATFKVQIAQLSACSSCHAKGACSASDVAEKIIEVEDTANSNLKIGDLVKLSGKTSMGMFAVLLAFVVPFSLLLATLIVAGNYNMNEAVSGIISLLILVPYFLILSIFKSKLKNKLKFDIEKI